MTKSATGKNTSDDLMIIMESFKRSREWTLDRWIATRNLPVCLRKYWRRNSKNSLGVYLISAAIQIYNLLTHSDSRYRKPLTSVTTSTNPQNCYCQKITGSNDGCLCFILFNIGNHTSFSSFIGYNLKYFNVRKNAHQNKLSSSKT